MLNIFIDFLKSSYGCGVIQLLSHKVVPRSYTCAIIKCHIVAVIQKKVI